MGKSKYYKVTKFIEVPHLIHYNWDSKCDETFSVMVRVDSPDAKLSSIVEVSKKEYENAQSIQTEEGGI